MIISGHASGADALGERYAQERGSLLDTYPADRGKSMVRLPANPECKDG